ncbi:hypothetical protein [Pasteurella multocida]|uniref:hypothetical protein n=1 Tax=Pasteurella multocida TaxID=747 RepID=UPI0039FCB175
MLLKIVRAFLSKGIRPLVIDSQKFTWYKHKCYQQPEIAQKITLKHKSLYLYDGDVYNYLGLEDLFDITQQEKKAKLSEDTLLVVFAASSPLFIADGNLDSDKLDMDIFNHVIRTILS